MAAKGFENPMSNDYPLGRRGNKPLCDHCHKRGHTRDTYWKIHGKPQNWKNPRTTWNTRAFHIAAKILDSQQGASPFSKEQLEHLQKLINSSTPSMPSTSFVPSNSNSVPSSSLALTGNFPLVFSVTIESNKPWIINSGDRPHD